MSNFYVPWGNSAAHQPRVTLQGVFVPPRRSAAPAPAGPATSLAQLKEGFLDFYCKTPQARGLLSRYWNGYGFTTKEANHDWAIWLAAFGFAIKNIERKS